MPGPKPMPIQLSRPERRRLGKMRRCLLDFKWRQTRRADVIFRAAAGWSNARIARDLGLSRTTVKLWRKRYAEEGFDGLRNRPVPGRPRKERARTYPDRLLFPSTKGAA